MTGNEVRRMFNERCYAVRIVDNCVEVRRFDGVMWRFSGYLYDYVTNAP